MRKDQERKEREAAAKKSAGRKNVQQYSESLSNFHHRDEKKENTLREEANRQRHLTLMEQAVRYLDNN